MPKSVVFILGTVLILGAVACGGGASPSNSSKSAPSPPQATAPPAATAAPAPPVATAAPVLPTATAAPAIPTATAASAPPAATAASAPPAATAAPAPPAATAAPAPTDNLLTSLWIGELLDEVEANEILAGQNYTDKWLSVTGHISHLGGAVWPRSGYEIEIEDVGGYEIKNSGKVYCYPQSSQEPLLTKLVTGDRIIAKGIVEELEGSYLATVRLKSCLIEDPTFNPESIDPSCVSLQGSYEDGYGYLTVEFTAQNKCDVAVWFAVAGSATFLNNQPWSFTVTDYGGDYFVLGPNDILVKEDMVEKPDWADGRPGEIQAADLDISLASATGLP